MTTNYEYAAAPEPIPGAWPATLFARSCAACGGDLPDDARFCPDCGTATVSHVPLQVGPATEVKSPTAFIAASLLCAALALLVVPVLLGPAAMLFGYLARRRDASVGATYMLIGGAATMLGIVLAFLLALTQAQASAAVRF